MADATSASMVEEKLPPMKAFRMLPNTGTSFLWGRYVEVGEIVLLTENQATAFRDRFEPADTSEFRTFTTAEIVELSKKVTLAEFADQTSPHTSPATTEIK